MNNKIQTFNFKHQSIRAVTINNIIYFVGRDISSVLQQEDRLIRNICKNAIVASNIISEEILNSRAILISESDLYRLVLKSKSSDADIFLDWIIDDVLPNIRKQIYLDELKAVIELEELRLSLNTENIN